jgi:acyl-CoA reductase-like NAD-dependent aldehyde dehydrogenase
VRAEQAVEDAKRALDAANRRWRELPRVSAAEYVREAARVLRYAASESSQSVESIMNQLMPRLPTGAVQQAWTVLDEVHRPAVRLGQWAAGLGQSTVGREKPRSPGIDM